MTMQSFYKNKKVFITGHTGFKGTWLSLYLDMLGAKIEGFSQKPQTNPSHFDLLDLPIKSTFGDISDLDALKKSINAFKPDILFHLAAQPLVRESYKNPINTYQTNVMGTLNVLEAIKSCPSIKSVVIITTDKVYENKEWMYPYRENDALGGHDMYSSSKACSEILTQSYINSFLNVSQYRNTHETLISTVRAGNVIGGGDWSDDRLIPDIVKATAKNETVQIRNPNAIRPWQHVLDCLHGYLLVGEKLYQGKTEFASPWNISPYNFEAKTVKEVAIISQKVWKEINIEFGVPPVNYHEANLLKLDNSKAISLLVWKPKWDTNTAIEKTIEWYKSFYLEQKILTRQNIEAYISQ
jgi:CDP-glucose 4,6-dehydratase